MVDTTRTYVNVDCLFLLVNIGLELTSKAQSKDLRSRFQSARAPSSSRSGAMEQLPGPPLSPLSPATMVTSSRRTIVPVTGPVLKEWLWKRIPRTTDTDKKSLRRLMKRMTSTAVFQKRWFEFDPNANTISYYREQPLGDADNVEPVGTILVKTIEKVVSGSDPKGEEATPSEHIFHIHCVGRVYTLCAPNENILTSWIKGVTAASDEEKRKKRRKRELQEKVLFSRARPSFRKWSLHCRS